MNTFEIESWAHGEQRKMLVTEPENLDKNEFLLKLTHQGRDEEFCVMLESGHWRLSDKLNFCNSTFVLDPLEVDSIGFQIAKFWCQRLEQRMEDFKVCLF